MKELNEIAWNVDEPTYREDPAYSYSTLARFNRSGFEGLNTLYDKVTSPSLTFGSMVDTMLTDGMDAFNNRFFVASFPKITDTLASIATRLYNEYKEKHTHIYDIADMDILNLLNEVQYQTRWKDTTRIQDVISKCEEYYNQLLLSDGKELVSQEDYQDCLNCIHSLQESESTKFYFSPNSPWDSTKRYYQLKFKGSYNNINLRCMADLIIVNYENKTIIPCDLKTSSHMEYDFYKSFTQWMYYIQAQLYWYIIRQNLDADPYFKDFKLLNYRFIVINKKSLNPLVWEYPDTQTITDSEYGNIKCRNWRNIVTELDYYLNNNSLTPKGIISNGVNNIVEWLKKQ